MTQEELNKEIKRIEEEAEVKKHLARMEFVEANKQFEEGDFIYYVCGIMKVKRISYQIRLGETEVRYVGQRYKKSKGVLSKTKNKYLDSFSGESLKKMDTTNLIIL